MTTKALSITQKIIRASLRLLPVLVAVAVVIFLVRTRSGPVTKVAEEVGLPMRVIDVPVVAFRPRETGYGLAEPARVWQAVAEVKGTVTSVSPQLKSGALVDEGTVLLEINRADYQLTVARLKAHIRETLSRIDELTAEKRNREASLKIEKRSLALARQSLERSRSLQEKNITSLDQVEKEERNLLQQEQAVQQIKNALAQLPARKATLEASLAARKIELEQAELDLKRTSIRAPFRCRIGEVSIEKGQFLTAGQRLFEAHGTAQVEVKAKFRPEQLRNLLPTEKRQQFTAGMTMGKLRGLFDLTVVIRLRSGEWEAEWPARFDRIREAVDPRTRAINVVALVEEPYAKVIPGIRPALVRGMYCEMELQAPIRPNTVVLPRSAVWNRAVYIVDAESRLRKRAVQLAFMQNDLAVIESGLTGRETVVVSDPSPAIEGQRIEAIVDHELQQRIVQQAAGRENSQ